MGNNDLVKKLLDAWNTNPKYQLHYGKHMLFDITQYNQDRRAQLSKGEG